MTEQYAPGAQRFDSSAYNFIASGLTEGLMEQGTAPTVWDFLTRSGIAHRLMWLVPEEALAEGWAARTGNMGEDVTEDEDARLDLRTRLIEAVAQARIDGGAWLWVVTTDDDWSSPIDLGQPHQVAAVHVVSRSELSTETRVSDPRDPRFGLPERVTLTLVRNGLTISERVHGSRLVYIPGSRATPKQRSANDGYDVSTLGLYKAAISDLERGWSSSATLVSRLTVMWMRLTKGHETGKDESIITSRLQRIARWVSTKSLVPLLNDDEIGFSSAGVQGAEGLIRALTERTSSVEGLPLTKVFGTAPGGLSTDDASGRETYNARLAGLRRDKAEPALRFVYRFLLGQDAADALTFDWPPLGEPGPAEAATIAETHAKTAYLLAQTDALYHDRQLVEGEEVRARLTASADAGECVMAYELAAGWSEEEEDPGELLDPALVGLPAAVEDDDGEE